MRPPAELSDEELLMRLATRDADALAVLYDRHRAIAYGLALRIVGAPPAAEDVLQEAFLGIWRQAGAYDPARGSGRGWLLAIVHHRAIDQIRRRRPADALPEPGDSTPAPFISPDVWPEVAGRLDAAEVRTALASISTVQREAIELAYWGGLSQSEIAARTGVPLGTVKGRMRLGLLSLRRALGADDSRSGEGDGADAQAHRPAGRSDGMIGRALAAAVGRAVAVLALLVGSARRTGSWVGGAAWTS